MWYRQWEWERPEQESCSRKGVINNLVSRRGDTSLNRSSNSRDIIHQFIITVLRGRGRKVDIVRLISSNWWPVDLHFLLISFLRIWCVFNGRLFNMCNNSNQSTTQLNYFVEAMSYTYIYIYIYVCVCVCIQWSAVHRQAALLLDVRT